MNRLTPEQYEGLITLIDKLLSGDLSEGERQALEATIQAEPDAARVVHSHLQYAGTMREIFAKRPMVDMGSASNSDSTASAMALAELAKLHEDGVGEPLYLQPSPPFSIQQPVTARTKIKARLIIGGGLAAVIAISGAVALVVSMLAQPTKNTTIVEQPVDETIIVATLTDTHDAEWDSPQADGALVPGSQLRAGQTLTLTAGFAEITTNDGAIALIEAPATIELINNNNALHLHTGKLVGICATDSSKGFLVRTPHMDITDLGTRFGVMVQSDLGTLAKVFSGRVLAGPAMSGQRSNAGVELEAGESYALDEQAHVVDQDRFAKAAFAGLYAMNQGVIRLQGEVRLVPGAVLEQEVEQWPVHPEAYLLQEFGSHRLTSSIPLTLTKPGVYQQFTPGQQMGGIADDGTVIRTYVLVHNNQGERSLQANKVVSGSVTFKGEILGVISGKTDIEAFSKVTQTSTLLWQAKKNRFFESISEKATPDLADLIELTENRRTLRFRILTATGATDAVRIVIREPATPNGAPSD